MSLIIIAYKRNPDCPESTLWRLVEMFHGPEEDIRKAALSVFAAPDSLQSPVAPWLAEQVSRSPAFQQVRNQLAFFLARTDQPLKPFRNTLKSIAESYLVKRGQADARSLSEALLRLYDESENDAEARSLCLDAWDALLESDDVFFEAGRALQRFD